MGGGLWSLGEISQIIFQFGEGFIIDFDGRTMQIKGTSVINGVVILLLLVRPNIVCYG